MLWFTRIILRWRVWWLQAQVADKESLMDDHQRRLSMLYDRLRRAQSALAVREDPRRMLDEALRRNT